MKDVALIELQWLYVPDRTGESRFSGGAGKWIASSPMGFYEVARYKIAPSSMGFYKVVRYEDDDQEPEWFWQVRLYHTNPASCGYLIRYGVENRDKAFLIAKEDFEERVKKCFVYTEDDHVD